MCMCVGGEGISIIINFKNNFSGNSSKNNNNLKCSECHKVACLDLRTDLI